MIRAWYNENDPFAAAWLRELIKQNLIAPGEVDERSIREVKADDLKGFTQCHFFAGIGVWSYALRCAGWPDEKRVWTGSCPCQPFSVSGKRAGASDERHLWPVWFPLIRESRPELVFGEQVASDDGLAWLDLVSTDMEGQDYTIGAVDTPACGFGAPHRRQRLYWMAVSERGGLERIAEQRPTELFAAMDGAAGSREPVSAHSASLSALADSEHDGSRRLASIADSDQSGERLLDGNRTAGSVADPSGRRREQRNESQRTVQLTDENGNLGDSSESGLERFSRHGGNGNQSGRIDAPRSIAETGSTNGFWRDAEWLWCRDQKYRPVEAGTFPLAHGVTKRVGKLRGFGNAIVAPAAQAFIEAAMKLLREKRKINGTS